MKRSYVWPVVLVCALSLGACGGEDSDTPAENTNNGENNAANSDENNAENNADENNVDENNAENNAGENNAGENNAGLPVGPYAGTYAIGLAAAPVGGLVLPFQAVVDSRLEGEQTVFKTVELRAAGEGDEVSDLLSTATDVVLGADGSFSLDFGTFVLPGDYTPTGSDVEVLVRMEGQAQEDGILCGDVTGEIITFGFDLAGSTFAATSWEDREGTPQAACDGGGPEELPRLDAEACPALEAGEVTGFASAGEERSFTLVVPEAYDAQTPAGLLFAFHGIGGTPGGLLESAEIQARANEDNMIIVAPGGSDVGGSAGWLNATVENIDVAFFDDMVTCMQAAYAIDDARVHVMGHSNGGLFASNLVRLRSDLLASAAPISGGWFVDLPSADKRIPVLVTWGGESDMAFDQDFNLLSEDLIEGLVEDDHFVVACDHGQGHGFPVQTWDVVFAFLRDHTGDGEGSPYEAGLPDSFPDYCRVVE